MTWQTIARLAIAEKATPGRWQVAGARSKFGLIPPMDEFHSVGPDGDAVAAVFYVPKHHAQHLADAQFIATFDPPTVLALIDAVTSAREALQQVADPEFDPGIYIYTAAAHELSRRQKIAAAALAKLEVEVDA